MMVVLTVIVAQRRINGVRISVITDVQLMNIKIIICLKGEIMENNNELLHEIANELGDETTGVKSDNYWLRRIHDKLRGVVSSLTDKVDKVNGASQITDANAGSYTNISNNLSSNSKQSDINSALNSIIGALLEVDLIRAVPSLSTPSSSTLGRLYLTPEDDPKSDDEYQVWATVEGGTNENPTYTWKRLDGVSLRLADYVQKSNTSGLLKNDGTVDTNTYLTSVPSHNQNLSTINNTSTVAVTVTYTDNTTTTKNLVEYTGS